ncbi:MAG: THO complex subunit 2 [Peltula sp. TS41687]|nr:MAG: THO complex subunit 2 [Peltula sp. TS41687]
MAMGPGKRKRGDRSYSHDEGPPRASPHRPANMQLAQQNPHSEYRHRSGGYQGNRRTSRGGRGGTGPRHDGGHPSPNATRPPPAPPATPVTPAPPADNKIEVASTQPRIESIAATKPQSPKQEPVQNNAVTSDPTPPAESPLYYYEYITDEIVASWKDTGRQTVIDAGVQARHDEDAIALGILYQELLQAGLNGRIDIADAGTVIKEVIGESPAAEEGNDVSKTPQLAFDAKLLFLDLLSIVTENDIPANLRTLIIATEIAPKDLRLYLEAPVLESLGLIRSTFGRMNIRKTTNLLYRQSNYNLLREETEGYSKLMTELFTTSCNEPPSGEVVGEVLERVKALIGAFDLDVGRVLDVILDVFASVLVKQTRFYVKLLRSSPWWPKEGQLSGEPSEGGGVTSLPSWALPGVPQWLNSDEEKTLIKARKETRDRAFFGRLKWEGIRAFFQLGRQRTDDDTPVESAKDDVAPETDISQKWIQATGTSPPPGNKVAAQLLGFKLRFYSSNVRDSNDVLPPNIIYLSALLIKIGFISLVDLYPHVWPFDDKMAALKRDKMKEKEEKERLKRPGGGAPNALMLAGALTDDTVPQSSRARDADVKGQASKVDVTSEKAADSSNVDDKDKLPEPQDQKVLLLKSLLCIGALPESLFILSRFPWLPDAYPELLEYIHRIMHHSLNRVYEPLRPLHERDSVSGARQAVDPDSSNAGDGPLPLMDVAPRRVLRWALPDKDDTSENTEFRFYWDDWADNVPICQSIDDVFLLCQTFGKYSGVKIGTDPTLLVKLVRIGRHSLAEDDSKENVERWVDLSKRLLVPALSLSKRNPGIVNEVYDLLKIFPTGTRYMIYEEWFTKRVSRLPDIRVAFEQVRAETKDVMKRISKTNIKPMARALAKAAYSSPGVVFAVALNQIESYDNLVEVVVECARYFTYLGYDVLTWALMNSLSGRGRNRVQADGMLTSKWLAALSLFAGRIFKRYSSLMNPSPILQYVTYQLRKGSTVDLIILKEMITSMAGIIPDTNFNDSQIWALSGGELLRQLTFVKLLDKRYESRTTAKRFIRSLTEPPLAGQLLISMAQARQTCIFSLPEEDSYLKLLGNLTDEVHRSLSQYLDLLRTNMTPSEFNSQVPDVTQLIADYGIDPSIAFWISRPSIINEMRESDEASAKKVQQEEHGHAVIQSDSDSDIKMIDVQHDITESQDKRKGNEEQRADVTKTIEYKNGDKAMKDVSSSPELSSPPPSTELLVAPEPWHPVLSTLMNKLKTTLPDSSWTSLSTGFYATFWQLSLYDIQVPITSYEEEIARLQKQWVGVNGDRSDPSITGSVRRDREKKQLTETQNRLSKEMSDHIQSFSDLKNRLKKEKDNWFAGFWGKWDNLNDALIDLCFVPRLLVSPTDALYAFRMLRLLHSIGTANFRTMGLIDHLLREGRLSNLVYVCTAREAENLGRFLNELLKELSRWHADKATYEREAFGNKRSLPGFAKKLVKDKVPETLLDYEDFRRLLYKWHKNINSALKACLTGGEYMHIRNAIIILKAVGEYFPAVNWNGRDQVTSVTELSKSEKRNDIKIAATSLLGALKKREKKWMLPQAFNLIESASTAVNAKSTPPQPQQQKATPALNVNAPAFQPKSQLDTNSPANKRKNHEVEDGEIDDARVKRARLQESTPTPAPGGKKRTPPPATTKASSTSKPATAVPTVAQATVHSETPTKQAMPAQSTSTGAIPSSTEINSGSRDSPQLPLTQSRPSSHGEQTRPEVSKDQPVTPASGQTQHSLPKRPETLPPPISRNGDWRAPDRSNTGDRSARDNRDGPLAESGRSERPMEPSREYKGDRRTSGASNGPRRQERSSDGPGIIERSRTELGRAEEKNPASSSQVDRFNASHNRDARPPDPKGNWNGTSNRDRPGPNDSVNHMRTAEAAPPARNTSMAPPRANTAAHNDRNASVNNEMDRRESRTQDRNDRRERPSRPSSSTRGDERRSSGTEGRYENRRDDHQHVNERHPSTEHESTRPARHEPTHPPTGPRVDRSFRISGQDNSNSAFDRPRDLFSQSAPPITQPVELNQGRLNQDSGFATRQPDPNYGRLNPTPEIPSGPRRNVPGRVGSRTASAVSHPSPTVQMDGRNQLPPHSLHQERSGLSSNSRVGHRSDSGQLDYPQSGHSTAPQTPVTESVPNDLAGVHPDRLKSLQRANEAPSNYGRPTAPHIETATPTTSNTYNNVQSTSPPSGPRGSQQQQLPSPVGPSPVARHPPTGPASVNDRNRGDKRFAGIQTVLQQAGSSSAGTPERSANERGTNIRGRASRSNTNGIGAPSPHSGPPTPVNGRSDYSFSRPNNAMIGTPEEDSRSVTATNSRNGRTRDDDNRDGGVDLMRGRPGRYRSSRSQSPHRGEHGNNNSRREREREHDRDRVPRRDDHRDHRSGGTGPGRDDNRRGGVRDDLGRDRDRRDRMVAENNNHSNNNNSGGGPGQASWGGTTSGAPNTNERRSGELIRSGGGRDRTREGDRDRDRDRERDVRDRDHHRHGSSRRPMVGPGPGSSGDVMNSRKRGRNESDVMSSEGRNIGGGGGQSHHGAGGDNKRVRRHP